MTPRSNLPVLLPICILALFVGGLITSVPSAIIRLVYGDVLGFWASQVFKLSIGPMILVACSGILLQLARGVLRIDVLSIALTSLGVLATTVGVVALASGENTLSHGINHLASIAMMAGLYTFGLNLVGFPAASFRRGLDLYGGTSVVVYGLSFFAFILARSSDAGYWGFGVDVLLAVTWYVASGRPAIATFASALILLNGKRMYTVGWIVAAAIMVLSLGRQRGWRWLSIRTSVAAATLGVATLGVLGALASGLLKIPSFVEETTKKWSLLANTNAALDLDRASAGRLTDLLRAWKFMEEDTLRWFTGAGIGHWWWDRGADYNQASIAWETHYTHFSPLNFVTLGGVPLAMFIAFAMAWTLLQTWRVLPFLDENMKPIVLALFAFVTSRVVEGMFANLYFSDPSLWFAFGLMGAASRRGAAKTAGGSPGPPEDIPLAEPEKDPS